MDKKETKQAVLDRMLNRHRCPKCHKLVPFETDTWCNGCRREKESKRIIHDFWGIANEIGCFCRNYTEEKMLEKVKEVTERMR